VEHAGLSPAWPALTRAWQRQLEWVFCLILRVNRTKLFHVKHFGTIGEAKIPMAAYILRLEIGAIARKTVRLRGKA
jgi:hypothetical protein